MEKIIFFVSLCLCFAFQSKAQDVSKGYAYFRAACGADRAHESEDR